MAAYEPGMGASESPGTSPTPSANRKTNPSPQLMSATSDTGRKLQPYLASIADTLKGLQPYLAQANRKLERLEQCVAPVVPQLQQPRAVPPPVTVMTQGTIIRYLVRKSENNTYRKSGA